jgi:hypothetical protein
MNRRYDLAFGPMTRGDARFVLIFPENGKELLHRWRDRKSVG